MDTVPRGQAVILWLARIGCTLAAVGLVMELASGLGYRNGWWGLRVALRYLFAYGGIVAAAGCVVALLAFVLTRARGPGSIPAAAGIVLGIMPALLFYHQYRLARSVPPINDISTDLETPPPFVAAAQNDFWKGKDMTYPRTFADSVRRGYPDLGSLVLPAGAGQTFALARQTAAGMPAWAVTGSDSAAGRIEATATTRWFGFKDDVVIRVTPRGADSAVVDMRSKSRVGKSDVGANAARIRAYFQALKRAAGP